MANIELTASQTRELQGMEDAINDLQSVLDRAERAGLDVAPLKNRLTELNNKRQGLLAEFTAGAANRRMR